MFNILGFIRMCVFIVYYILEAFVIQLIPRRYRRKDVDGRVVLITGTGGVIGRHLAIHFSQLGCKIICWDVAKQANEETARLVNSSGGKAFAYHVDLRNRHDVYEKAEIVKREVGKVDILINNAGVLTANDLLDTKDEHILRTFEVNSLAHFWTVKSFLGDMIEQDRGHIVTVSSMAGLYGANCMIDYSASKFAAFGFDEALRVELDVNGHKNIKTTVVCPYFVKTPLTHGVVETKLLETIPQLDPKEVADRIVDAVLCEEISALIPKSMEVLVVSKAMLPHKANQAIGEFLGAKDGVKIPKKD